MTITVWPVNRKMCSNCGQSWETHLVRARERIKGQIPDRFYEKGGTEYPTWNSLFIEDNVTNQDCPS